MAIISFLAGIPSEFETAKNQILFNPEISSLQDVYNRVLHTEGTQPVQTPPVQFSSALVSRNNEYDFGRSQYRGGG